MDGQSKGAATSKMHFSESCDQMIGTKNGLKTIGASVSTRCFLNELPRKALRPLL